VQFRVYDKSITSLEIYRYHAFLKNSIVFKLLFEEKKTLWLKKYYKQTFLTNGRFHGLLVRS